MKKLILAFATLAIITVSCQNSNTKNENTTATEEVVVEEIVVVDLVDFDDIAEDLVGKQVVLTGMIDHVCEHGGQKMFLVNENADTRIKIVPGEDMAAFNTELEGESVKVVGIVDEFRIDEEYLREWEEEVLAGLSGEEGEKGEKVHMGDGEGEHHDEENADLRKINNFREQIAESDKDYISFYSIVCVEYEVDEVVVEEGI
jgi:hypothetical protein